MKMAQDPQIGYEVIATILGVKGECSAGHTEGQSIEISCHNPAGLCGWLGRRYDSIAMPGSG
jgi:hypothetical protein